MKELKVLYVLFALSLNYGHVHSQILNLITDFLNNSSNLLEILHPPTFPQLAAQYGLTAETHQVISSDGYIITLFRLRGNGTAPPILLCHGILDSADTWLIRGNASLAYNLVKRKHDVWLMNCRGNRYSNRHLFLNAINPAYWNFTFHEMALNDLSVAVDFVLNRTGASKLNYIGHSQGTTLIWILLSTKTQYNAKFNVATALAPICYIDHILPPFRTLLKILYLVYPLLRQLGIASIGTDYSPETLTFKVIAQIPVIGYFLDVISFLFPLFGADAEELEPEFLPIAGLHFPNGNSIKDLVHYAQIARSATFARFDYGEAGNLVAYNSTTPPPYALRNITSKIVLLAALNDKTAQLQDVNRLRNELPNVLNYTIIPRPMMNHIDYVWGRTAFNYLFPHVFAAVENYN